MRLERGRGSRTGGRTGVAWRGARVVWHDGREVASLRGRSHPIGRPSTVKRGGREAGRGSAVRGSLGRVVAVAAWGGESDEVRVRWRSD
jgi:hypothetical protein